MLKDNAVISSSVILGDDEDQLGGIIMHSKLELPVHTQGRHFSKCMDNTELFQ